MKATPPTQSWQPWAISPLSPGRRIGAYRIEALLARGGMAYVYQAVHVMLGRAVAIKILPAVAAADTDARTRFGYEARSVASLRHPHILEIFDAGEVDDLPYLVTELVTGGTLADQLREHRAPVERLRLALTTARAIGSALDYAHRQGVLHRDVKPSNILLTGTGRLILADFGLAQVREATIRVTQPGDFWGSLDYSSPEQLQGEAVCSRSDLYSLGVVLYEILAGRVPFATDTPMATALAHLHQPPPAVHDLAPGLPPSTDDVLAKGLAKSPQDRYGTGAALTAAVAGVAAEGGATDAPPAWAATTPPPAAPVPLPEPLDESADSTAAPARTPPAQGECVGCGDVGSRNGATAAARAVVGGRGDGVAAAGGDPVAATDDRGAECCRGSAPGRTTGERVAVRRRGQPGGAPRHRGLTARRRAGRDDPAGAGTAFQRPDGCGLRRGGAGVRSADTGKL